MVGNVHSLGEIPASSLEISDATWMDDLSMFVLSDSAETLIGDLTKGASILIARLKLVPAYKHLGGFLQHSGGLRQEIAFRIAQAWDAFNRRKKKLFKSPLVSLQDKATIFQSLVITVLFHGAGTWTRVDERHLSALDSTLRQMACQMLAPEVSLSDAWHLGASQVLAKVGLPRATTHLHIARLRHLLACVNLQIPEIWALAHWEETWLSSIRASIEWLWELTDGGKCFSTWPSAWEAWREECRLHPGKWKSRLRRATQQALQHENWQACCEQHAGLLVKQACNVGAVTPLDLMPEHCTAEVCAVCKAVFKDFQAWSVHAFKRYSSEELLRLFQGFSASEGESREAFRTAKVTMDNADWKKAHKLRKRARKDWCAQRRQRILQGDWLAYREHKRDKNRRPGWWGRMLEEKSSSQVTEEVQAHLEAKLIGPTSVDWDQQLGEILASLPDDGGWHPFSWEDINLVLGEMKANTSVGVDQVGVDLLKKIMQHNDLAHDLVGLINQTLWTTQCREKWDRSLLALLAKIDSPMSAKDLRPISMSSCVQKCLNKLAMNRVFPHLRQPSMASCCGPGRQASDAIGAFTRLRDNVREWKLPAVCAKLDVRGACDRVHRQAAVQLMCDRTRNHKLNAEVRWLIRQLGTNQLQGCVPGGDMICVECTQGIKQGAPESAELFGRRELVVGNQRVKILPSETRIRVVGANFSFYDRPSQQAKDLLARAKAALAVQDDLLREKGPWQAKAKLLQTLVFGTMSWCAGAVHWSQEDLATANTIQCTALRSGKHYADMSSSESEWPSEDRPWRTSECLWKFVEEALTSRLSYMMVDLYVDEEQKMGDLLKDNPSLTAKTKNPGMNKMLLVIQMKKMNMKLDLYVVNMQVVIDFLVDMRILKLGLGEDNIHKMLDLTVNNEHLDILTTVTYLEEDNLREMLDLTVNKKNLDMVIIVTSLEVLLVILLTEEGARDPVHPVADDPWEEGRDALDVYSEDSRLAQEDGHNEEVDDDVITGIIGDLAGVDVDGEWISVNQLLEEFARGGNIPWIPINELLKQAEAQFRMIRREQRALLNSASAGKVRRWGEWRPGTDRWHNLDGSKRENVASSSASGSSDPGQSSDDLSNRGETSADLNHEDATDKSAHREAGFWRYGEWQDRPRSWTEQRWMAGGQGKVRQDKRAARIEQWAKGEWVPSWLRQYRVDKEARQRSSSTTGASSSQEPHRQLPDDDLPPVPEEDFDNTGLLQGRLQWTPAGEESDESTFMERPGLQGGEINALVDRGISGDLVRRFERVMRRYEHYLSNEQGPEARWMLGRWLQMSQWGADIQDDAEEPIRRRAQDPCVFPLRREPSDTLRGELQEWVGELTEVMAEIWTHGVRSATPGTLRDLDAHPAVATASGSRGRSRSPARRPLPPREDEGDITNLMDYGGYGSSGGADEPENDEEHVPPNEETVEDGAAASESAGGVGPILTGGDLPSMLGPVGAEALEPPDTRMSELLDRELEHAEQAYLIEVAVREAMYRPSAGTSREVVRRLLQCSQHDSEIQYWLQKALQQALRSCPPGREGGDMSNWREAVEYEGVIWQRVVGLTADDRMVRRLREVVQQRLQRRAERLAELDARTWTGSSGDTRPGPYAGGGTRNRPPWRRDPASGRGNTRGAGGLRDARPSLAPHLLPRGSPETLPGRRRSLHAAALRHGGSHVADPSHPAVDPPPASGPTRDVHVAVGPTEDDEPTVEDVQTCEGEPDADAPVDAGVVGLPLAEHAAVNPVEEPVPGGALAGEGGLRGAVVSTGENDDLVDSDESVNIELLCAIEIQRTEGQLPQDRLK
ncbi:unnamed protein product, partial [Symbiodinium sp. KB8]